MDFGRWKLHAKKGIAVPYMVFFSAPTGENDVEEYEALVDAARAIEDGVVGGRSFQRLIEIRDVPIGLDVTVRLPHSTVRDTGATEQVSPDTKVATPSPVIAAALTPDEPAVDIAQQPVAIPEPSERIDAFAMAAPQSDFGIFGR